MKMTGLSSYGEDLGKRVRDMWENAPVGCILDRKLHKLGDNPHEDARDAFLVRPRFMRYVLSSEGSKPIVVNDERGAGLFYTIVRVGPLKYVSITRKSILEFEQYKNSE